MSLLEHAIERIRFTRIYSLQMLKGVDAGDWFRMAGDVTHLAWQLGHLAVAEHFLTVMCRREAKPEDEQLISQEFFRTFGRGSTPVADPSKYPDPSAIRDVVDRVHKNALLELGELTEDEANEPALHAHPAFTTKLGALDFCSEHEMLHAGQIGLVRRLLGYEPAR